MRSHHLCGKYGILINFLAVPLSPKHILYPKDVGNYVLTCPADSDMYTGHPTLLAIIEYCIKNP
jgi:hypothetical protein